MGLDSFVIGDYKDRRKADHLIYEFIKVIRSSHSKDLRERLKELQNWCPEGAPDAVRKECEESGVNVWEIPLFTEMYLYPLLGKDNARTLLALMRPVWELIGEGELY